MPRFIHKNMEEIYVEEQKTMIKQLMSIHLEAFPVTKGGLDAKSALYKMKRYSFDPHHNCSTVDSRKFKLLLFQSFYNSNLFTIPVKI